MKTLSVSNFALYEETVSAETSCITADCYSNWVMLLALVYFVVPVRNHLPSISNKWQSIWLVHWLARPILIGRYSRLLTTRDIAHRTTRSLTPCISNIGCASPHNCHHTVCGVRLRAMWSKHYTVRVAIICMYVCASSVIMELIFCTFLLYDSVNTIILATKLSTLRRCFRQYNS